MIQKILTATILPLLLISAGFPSIVRAENEEEAFSPNQMMEQIKKQGSDSMARGMRELDICGKLETASDTIMKTHGERTGAMKERAQKLEDHIKTMRSETEGKMKTERMNADGHHQEAIAKLKKLAGNDADKKAAVATFEATLKTLITTRRTAVDMAVKNFQDGVVALKTERGTAMSSWSSSNEEALENAMESVRTACANGGESKEAALAFKKAMTASREEFKGAKSEFDFQTRLKALQQVRKDAIAKAVADFKTGFDAAKTILKTAMGESVSE